MKKRVFLILVSVFFISTCVMAQEYTNEKEEVLQKREEMRKMPKRRRKGIPCLISIGMSERKFKRNYKSNKVYLEGVSDDGSCSVYIQVREREDYFYFFREGVLVKIDKKPIAKKPKKDTNLYIGMSISEFDEIMGDRVTLLVATRDYRKYREESYNKYGERNGFIYIFEKGRLYKVVREE